MSLTENFAARNHTARAAKKFVADDLHVYAQNSGNRGIRIGIINIRVTVQSTTTFLHFLHKSPAQT